MERTASASSSDITVASSDNASSSIKPKKVMLGIKHLPEELRSTYSTTFSPRYVEYIGRSAEPWTSPGVDVMQLIFDNVYSNYDCTVEPRSAVCDVV